MSENTKGLFIMIEGTDGCGKSTQTELLVEHLKKEGYAVEHINFPQYGTPSAQMVEQYLNGELGTADEVGPYRASIFFAIDRYAAATKIRNWLENGTVVIANRYVGSNMGHQGGKISDPKKRQAYFDWNYHLEYTIFDIPKPNVNLILHMPAVVAQQLVDKKEAREYLHGKKRDIHEDDLHHLLNAEAAYLDIAKRYPEFTVVECAKDDSPLPKEEIHELIWKIIKEAIHLHI